MSWIGENETDSFINMGALEPGRTSQGDSAQSIFRSVINPANPLPLADSNDFIIGLEFGFKKLESDWASFVPARSDVDTVAGVPATLLSINSCLYERAIPPKFDLETL